MSEPVIQTEGLTKRYGKLAAVDGVTLEAASGRVLALMGPNGAGKTSLIKMLLGLTSITEGKASVFGLDSHKQHVEIRRRVGYVPETHQMYGWMTIREITRFTSAFYPAWDAALCGELIDRFGLDPAKKISELSRGMVAKVALTLALAHKPQLLVLDEPTSGLDAMVRKEFLESVVNVAADEGRTVLISSHLLNDVERVADRVALMDNGKIRLVEDLEQLKERLREVRITFSAAPPESLAVPDILSLAKAEHEWLAVIDHFGADTMTELQAQLPGATLVPRALNLEEIFVALVGQEKHVEAEESPVGELAAVGD